MSSLLPIMAITNGPPRAEDGQPLQKRRKKINLNLSQKKCPLMVLNEMKSDLSYIFDEKGPSHARVFSVSAFYGGRLFTAEDTTKKKAKRKVASMILKQTIQLKDPTINSQLRKFETGSVIEDFSVEPLEVALSENSTEFVCHESSTEHVLRLDPGLVNTPENSCSSPLFYLQRVRPDIKVEIIKEEGLPHDKKFTARVVIDGRNCEGVGPSKKHAKTAAAQEALRTVLLLELPKPEPAQVRGTDFGDLISKLIETSYQNLTQNEQPNITKFKVLAGIVMTKGSTAEDASVICITTGSKCVSGSYLSMEGETINDCHAEILARRCLVDYLYDQLDTYKEDPDQSIFDTSCDSQLKLKHDIKFHLYISSAPCGDSRIFTLNNAVSSPFEDLHPNRQGRGALRTKIESGEGTIPVAQTIQTWDGILQGERLLTMSCSDKLARWNVLGVQGSLLSLIIQPIYLHTVVVGNLFHQVHLNRALIGRIEHIRGLPSPFMFYRPTLTATSSPPPRMPTKSPKHSICWTLGWPANEMIDVQKGKLMDGSISRLCKKSFFNRFAQLVSNKWEWRSFMELNCRNGYVCYKSVKRAARDFGEAKEMLESAFVIAQYGQWIKKPPEQDTFEISFEFNRSVDVKVESFVQDPCPSPLGF